jgi:hypothetical protein
MAVEVLVEYTNTLPPDSSSNEMDRGNAQPALMRGVVRQVFSDVQAVALMALRQT